MSALQLSWDILSRSLVRIECIDVYPQSQTGARIFNKSIQISAEQMFNHYFLTK